MTDFWHLLPNPFFVLAPMEDVTDTVFRQMVTKVGKPHVFFTEFTNVDGLLSPGAKEVGKRLKYSEGERPIIAQLWGAHPEKFSEAAKLVKDLGFDGIDLNFGCPERSIVKQGGCSALIGNFKIVQEIITATHNGADGLPVSLKTRLGRKQVEPEWLDFLLEQPLAALTIHGRTAAEMSAVPAHWDEIGKVVAKRNKIKSQTLLIGNGDVMSLPEAREKVSAYGVDGVMIGRGIFSNVGLFAEKDLTVPERLQLLMDHVELFESTWGKNKHFPILKKFVKTYVTGFPMAAQWREGLMQTRSTEELIAAAQRLLRECV